MPRGTKRFSLKPGAVSRYYFTAEYMAVHMRMLRDMIGQYSFKLPHPDLQGPLIRKDEADIKSLIDLMENNWLNPLSPDESDLVSLSTGTVTPTGSGQGSSKEHSTWEKKRIRRLNGPD